MSIQILDTGNVGVGNGGIKNKSGVIDLFQHTTLAISIRAVKACIGNLQIYVF